jgi:peptidyl-tRNA hydrolase PTH2
VTAAQLTHAAGESSTGSLPPNTFAVVLQVPDEAALLAVHARLVAAAIPCHLIREPDAPWNGQAMALGVAPLPRARVRPLLSNLPLLR